MSNKDRNDDLKVMAAHLRGCAQALRSDRRYPTIADRLEKASAVILEDAAIIAELEDRLTTTGGCGPPYMGD